VAEQLVTIRDRRGYARQEWQKLRERNEALDARVYARAAAWILGADRFDERMWRQLEKQAGVETAMPRPRAEKPKPRARSRTHHRPAAARLEDQHAPIHGMTGLPR
jgi:phage terminase large subunit GpA-like protein